MAPFLLSVIVIKDRSHVHVFLCEIFSHVVHDFCLSSSTPCSLHVTKIVFSWKSLIVHSDYMNKPCQSSFPYSVLCPNSFWITLLRILSRLVLPDTLLGQLMSASRILGSSSLSPELLCYSLNQLIPWELNK